MRKLYIILLVIFSLSASFSAFAQKGEKTMEILAGYNTKNKSAIAGLAFQYRFNSFFRLAPDFQYIFRNNNLSAFQFNGNAHFIIKMDTRLNFYPLIGISYQNWKNSIINNTDKPEDINDKRFGGNFGAGFEYMATSTLKISVEGKYSWIKNYPSTGITMGIGYLF